jgi:predicted ester cyclase
MSKSTDKQLVWEYIQAMQFATPSTAKVVIEHYFADDAVFHGCHPINTLQGRDSIISDLVSSFYHAFPNAQRRDDILFAGHFNDKNWVCTTGHYTAVMSSDWLGIPASGEVTFIRYGEFYQIDQGKIVAVYSIYDIPHVMAQAGYPIFPTSLGTEITIPGPSTHDGVILGESDDALAAHAQRVVEEMIAGLMQYDGKDLASMPIEPYWHPHFMWYGPYGIGTTRGLHGFREGHQRAFLHAFPDRVGGNHVARFAENGYVASTGWPSIKATHQGGGWCGLPARGDAITMRVMDWWRVDKTIHENWVFIDMLDFCRQIGYDALGRLADIRRAKAPI